jgi:RNA polymerase sigma factor (sigma-70 family)
VRGAEMDELTRLAVEARCGELATMASFIRATQAEVYLLCAFLVDKDTAEDLAQEAYLRIFREMPDYRRESSARTWLLSITRRVCIHELRRRRREMLVPEFSTGLNSEWPGPPVDDEQTEMHELLKQLPEERRSAHPDTRAVLCRRRAHLWVPRGNHGLPGGPSARRPHSGIGARRIAGDRVGGVGCDGLTLGRARCLVGMRERDRAGLVGAGSC